MTDQETHRQEILAELGDGWIEKERSMLISFGTSSFGMSEKEASDLADFTIDDLLQLASERKRQGKSWKTLFESNLVGA